MDAFVSVGFGFLLQVCTNTGDCFCRAGFRCPDCQQLDRTNLYGKLCEVNPNKFSKQTLCREKCFNKGVRYIVR